MLTVKNLSYRQGMKRILTDISFQVETGEFIGLLGENGVGKTTLMRALTGLVIASKETQISLDGHRDWGSILAHTAFVPNLNWASQGMTIWNVVSFYQAGYPDFNQNRWQEIAEELQINSKDKVGHLSKGQRERLVFALTVSRDASLFLLDEPFGGVDVMTRRKLLQSLLRWLPDGAMVLMSTHEISEIEPVIDRAIILKHGCLVADKEIEVIREQYQMTLEQYFMKQHAMDRKGVEA